MRSLPTRQRCELTLVSALAGHELTDEIPSTHDITLPVVSGATSMPSSGSASELISGDEPRRTGEGDSVGWVERADPSFVVPLAFAARSSRRRATSPTAANAVTGQAARLGR